ncbi:MAG: glycosyltransferase family 2 protein [Dehalococcoidia bacterium]|nr:glycosyltransferase family 2 protein [Dehalococcoidia bacterium]
MYRDKKIGVVVPAYNEELHIGKVLQGMPDYVDSVYVVDDASTDRTADIVRDFVARHSVLGGSNPQPANPQPQPLAGELRTQNPEHRTRRVELIRHAANAGVGAAIVTGYKRSLVDGLDIAVVMAGDNQMEPAWLPVVLDPVVDGRADYSKGTRLTDPAHLKGMSAWRRLGNSTLRRLTVIASGNPGVTDPQHGYTAISRNALETLDLDAVYPYYGYCNDLVVRLSAQRRSILEIPMPSMYHGEVSKIRYHKYMPKVSMLLLRLFIWRITGRLSARRTPAVASSESAPVEESRA